jgi:hypothetical protein
MENVVTKKLKRYKELKEKKQYWHPLWQKVGEYVHTRKQDFTTSNMEGSFLNQELYDTTAAKASKKMAAALIGNLWPNGGRSMRLTPVKGVKNTKEIKDYFEKINDAMIEALDDPNAGFVLALDEYMNDQTSFGSSGIFCQEGDSGVSDLSYSAWGVDEVCIDESISGRVDTLYREFEWTVRKVISKYGEDNVSQGTRDKWKNGSYDDKIKILHLIEPREYTPGRKGNRAMPFMSMHIEIDSKKLLKESGFEEIPTAFARFFKKRGEKYGRSPAMDALPDTLEINATREARITAIEKSLDPPLGIENDGILGSGSVDTSAGAINVLNMSGRAQSTSSPIFPLYTVGTIREADKSIEELRMSIKEHFSIDRLLDFNNQVQMTLGEAQMRETIRAQGLGSLFIRQTSECITPTLERSVSVMFRKGKLGYFSDADEVKEAQELGLDVLIIPDEIAEIISAGKDFYQIRYETPAARLMRAEEAQGIARTWEFAMQLAQVDPEVLDTLDADKSLEIISEVSGAPVSIKVSEDLVLQIREQRAAQMQQQQQAQMQQEQMGQVQQAADITQTMEQPQNEQQ